MAIPKIFARMLFLIVLSLTTRALAYCQNFKQSRNYYTVTSSNEQIISRGYVCDIPNSNYTSSKALRCDPRSECPAITSGVVNNMGTNNLSLRHDEVLPLYALIPTKTYYTPPSFLYSLSGNVTAESSCLKAHIANGTVNDTTTAGYFSFVPTLLCIEGTLSQCEDGPVENDTPIKICAVNALDLGADGIVPNGVQKWVATDVDTARKMTRNPALSREVIGLEAGPSLEELGINTASIIVNRKQFWIWLSLVVTLVSW